jgi:dienelactone hydrolase
MDADDRKTPEQLGMKTIVGDLAGRLKEGSPLQKDAEALHAVVYSAPARQVAQDARELAEQAKRQPGVGRVAYDLLEAAKQVKF